MAVTERRAANFLTLIPDGASSWQLSEDVIVVSIDFHPSAANDVLCMKTGAEVNAPEMFMAKSLDGGNLCKPMASRHLCRPFLDNGSCVFGTPANVRIILEIA